MPPDQYLRINFGLALLLYQKPRHQIKRFLMKDKNSANIPTAEMLAAAWRQSPGFGAPHWHEGKWIWLSPHGDAYTKCGSPIRPPHASAIKPHETQLWEKCWRCQTIRPWGGCGSKTPEPQWVTWRTVSVNKTPTPQPTPELTEVDSPTMLLIVLEKMTDCAAYGDWLLEDEIVSVATKHFNFKINATSLLDLLRPLWQAQKIEHKRNQSGQHTFRLKGGRK